MRRPIPLAFACLPFPPATDFVRCIVQRPTPHLWWRIFSDTFAFCPIRIKLANPASSGVFTDSHQLTSLYTPTTLPSVFMSSIPHSKGTFPPVTCSFLPGSFVSSRMLIPPSMSTSQRPSESDACLSMKWSFPSALIAIASVSGFVKK